MAAGVRGDQQLSKGLLGRKKERKPTCGGDGTKAPLPSVGRYTAQAKCKRLVGEFLPHNQETLAGPARVVPLCLPAPLPWIGTLCFPRQV